ncbi:hypothetical protein LTR85_007296 [Meristemomyces frigidus]|nr:hypothetical protein LTR85_007296 [Meristemomyces frigidus]
MPVLLLFLPALTAGETFYDYRNKRMEDLSRESREDATSPGIGESVSSREDDSTRQELLLAGKRFDKDVDRIKDYFRGQVRLQITEGPKEDEMHILRRKSALLTKFELITTAEDATDSSLAFAFFAADITVSVVMGVLLNVGGSALSSITGAFLFIGWLAARLGSVFYMLFKLRREGQEEKGDETGSIIDQHQQSQTLGNNTGRGRSGPLLPAVAINDHVAEGPGHPAGHEAADSS